MVATAIESQSEFDQENAQKINRNKIGIKPVRKKTQQILQVTRVDCMTSETGEGRFFASNLSKNGDVNSK